MHFHYTAAHGHTTAGTKQTTTHAMLPGAAVAAQIKPETKTKTRNQNQSKAHETCPTQCNKRKTQQPKAMQPQQHAVSKNTYCRETVLPNEKDEPKMTKARCNLRRRCRYLQCVRDGEGGAAVAAPIKPEIKTRNQKPNQSA
jgi:hypothetical protein